MGKPFLSIIICTYNRESILKKCLSRLGNQSLKSYLYEIIAVDNNSSDATKVVVGEYRKRYPNLLYTFEKNQGLSYARNRGFHRACGQYLIYIDDDVILPSGYLRKVYKTLIDKKPDILGGPVYPYYLSPKPHWFKDEFQIRKYGKKSCFSNTCRISGGNFVIKKNLLRRLGKFDTSYGMKGNKVSLGEEAKVIDQYRNITPTSKQKVYYSLDCYVRHLVTKEKMTFAYVNRRFYEGGKLNIKMRLLHEGLSVRILYTTVVYNLYKLIKRLYQNILDLIRHGYKRIDYILISRDIFFC